MTKLCKSLSSRKSLKQSSESLVSNIPSTLHLFFVEVEVSINPIKLCHLDKEGDLNVAKSSYFDLGKLISIKKPSISFLISISVNSFEGMSSLTYTKIPPP